MRTHPTIEWQAQYTRANRPAFYDLQMRIAVVADVHGNLLALESVIADLRLQAPDLVVHGGDLALLGVQPAEVSDRIADLGWEGVVGNTDEMLWDGSARPVIEARAPALVAWLATLFDSLGPWAAERLGSERIGRLRALPSALRAGPLTLVHAAPGDLWTAPPAGATDDQLSRTYAGLGVPLAVYGHIHRGYVRAIANLTVANTGAAGLPWDGDSRPSYLLVTDGVPEVRRVDHDLQAELRVIRESDFPLREWLIQVRSRAEFIRP